MKRILFRFRYAPILFPLVFIIVFFGYLHPRFDLTVYTGNIKGEGTCTTYLSSLNQPFSYLYQADTYFGSELKTLKMQDLRYDVNEVSLYVYNIEEADILSYDITVFGLTVLHHNSEGDKILMRPAVNKAVSSTEKSIAHIVNENPQESYEIDFEKSIGIPLWVWIGYFTFLILITLFVSLAFDYLVKRLPILELPIIELSCVSMTMILGCLICGSLPYVNYTDFLLNLHQY